MAKKEIGNLNDILKDIKQKKFAPVYFLMGDESYFIDLITHEILTSAITEEEKDFNLTTLYGGESTVDQVLNSARRYPMMAQYQITLVREAQMLDSIEKLEFYLEKPLPSTILILQYRHKTYDSRKKLFKLASSHGVVYEAKRLYDNQVPDFIMKMVKARGFSIEPPAVMMMTDNIGSDLVRIASELDKLCIGSNTARIITRDIVSRQIGISKEYNNFELLRAVVHRDIYKANLIINHFKQNPKGNPPIVVLSVLYNYFANLMLCYYAPDKTERGLMAELNIKTSFMVKDYLVGLKAYNAFKVMENISLLREYDAKLKGVGSYTAPADLLKEMIFKLMH